MQRPTDPDNLASSKTFTIPIEACATCCCHVIARLFPLRFPREMGEFLDQSDARRGQLEHVYDLQRLSHTVVIDRGAQPLALDDGRFGPLVIASPLRTAKFGVCSIADDNYT